MESQTMGKELIQKAIGGDIGAFGEIINPPGA